ncbi:MAG: hypothetical protein EHM58_04600 [Ignavibacteriae bacterium]|nr:MAG: hypothetical protein EHM58_04600 [Ignavibacteriota bacterium]
MKINRKTYQFFFFCISIFLFLLSSNLTAQTTSGGKLSGLVFGDYFYKLSGDSSNFTGEFAPYPKTYQAFTFRRIYLTYNHVINEKFSAQFQLESSEKIITSTRYGVFIKTAFLEWANIFKGSNLQIGLVPTATWALNEKFWNYRPIEKTLIDFRGLGGASDMGITLKGNFEKEGNYGYTAMIGNGNGQKPEFNKLKKYYASLFAKPVKGLTIEAYSDFEPFGDVPNVTDTTLSVKRNKMTLRGFAGYQTERLAVGGEFVQQTQKNFGAGNTDVVPMGFSFYVWGNILKGNTKTGENMLNAFARFDMYDPNTKIDSVGFKENFLTAGLDYMPFKDVHFMPNVWFNSYTDKSSANIEKKADVVVRMTFFYVYK